jgi:heat shock protein HslJ
MNFQRFMSNHYSIVAALLLVALVFATACGGPAATTSDKGGDEIAPLTEQALKNAAYRGIYAEAVQLTDGKYEGEPFVEGGASRPTVTFTDAYAWGDLNSDGVDDAVVVLVENSGGTGNFRYLAAVLNENGSPENVATQLLGDRVQVQSVTVVGAEITVKAVAHGPDDPMCCPTQEVTLVYGYDGEQLVKVSEETAAAEADIIDVTWQWTELIETEPASQSLVPDPENYTLVLRSDGTYQVQADCNLSSSEYTLEGNNLTLLPGPTTLAECEPDSLYDEYLAFLSQVVTFELEGEKLVLNLKDGAGKMGFVKGMAKAEIIDIIWQWTGLVETEPASQSLVPNPENYTLVLRSDGTYQVQADCNLSSGSYTLDGNRLTLLPGPTTLAECEPDSLYDLYLTTLGSVESLSVEDGRLILHLRDNAGRMVFRNAGLAGETDGGAVGADITGTVWMWEETTTPTGVTSVDDPEKYTIELLPDGQFRVNADCNSGSGSYTLGDGHVSFEFGPMTLAECEPGSLSDQFIQELNAAAIYFLEGEDLFIDLKFDSGTMRFAPGG